MIPLWTKLQLGSRDTTQDPGSFQDHQRHSEYGQGRAHKLWFTSNTEKSRKGVWNTICATVKTFGNDCNSCTSWLETPPRQETSGTLAPVSYPQLSFLTTDSDLESKLHFAQSWVIKCFQRFFFHCSWKKVAQQPCTLQHPVREQELNTFGSTPTLTARSATSQNWQTASS